MKDLQMGRVIVHARTDSTDPLTEAARKVERVSMTTPEAWTQYKTQGGCGKPASSYSLYCDNHEALHRNDNVASPIQQFVDNRPGGRQRVILCAHRTAPTVPQTPAMHTPTMNATTNVQKGQKEITMSTNNTTTANANLDAITAQIAALNAALAALSTPTAPAPAPTAPAPAPTAPAPAPATTYKNDAIYEMVPDVPTTVTITGFVDAAFNARPTVFKTGNVGYTGSTKATCRINGKEYQVSINLSEIHRKPK